MKREILFKAKRVDNCEWIEGFYWCEKFKEFPEKHWVIETYKDKKGFHQHGTQVHPETVCQFTGKEINGIKLFEGDKVKSFHFKGVNDHGRGRKNYFLEHVILWNNEYSCWMASSDGTTELKPGNVQLFVFLKNMIEPKIIGNIQD